MEEIQGEAPPDAEAPVEVPSLWSVWLETVKQTVQTLEDGKKALVVDTQSVIDAFAKAGLNYEEYGIVSEGAVVPSVFNSFNAQAVSVNLLILKEWKGA
jgi:hypothetical protein